MQLKLLKYSELSETQINQILALIIAGGEVNPNGLSNRLMESELLAFFEYESIVIAVAAIKKPADNYKKSVFEKSKSNLSSTDYFFELGYIMVNEKFRGQKLASRLCEELSKISLEKQIFATTRVENDTMKRILKKNHYIELGIPYLSSNKTTNIQLFIKMQVHIIILEGAPNTGKTTAIKNAYDELKKSNYDIQYELFNPNPKIKDFQAVITNATEKKCIIIQSYTDTQKLINNFYDFYNVHSSKYKSEGFDILIIVPCRDKTNPRLHTKTMAVCNSISKKITILYPNIPYFLGSQIIDYIKPLGF